jgi:hypothetical protein
MSTSRNYYDENIATEEKIIIYQQGNAFVRSYSNKQKTLLSYRLQKIVGFYHKENFKRFYKVPGLMSRQIVCIQLSLGDLQFNVEVFIPIQ